MLSFAFISSWYRILLKSQDDIRFHQMKMNYYFVKRWMETRVITISKFLIFLQIQNIINLSLENIQEWRKKSREVDKDAWEISELTSQTWLNHHHFDIQISFHFDPEIFIINSHVSHAVKNIFLNIFRLLIFIWWKYESVFALHDVAF